MRRRFVTGALVVAVAGVGLVGCSSGGTTAESASPSPSASVGLEGVWKSSERTLLAAEGFRGSGTETLKIGPVEDDVFEATRIIKVEEPFDFGDGTQQTSARLKTFGVVRPDGSFTIVKEGDDGRLDGWVIDANTIEAVYTESGDEPLVVRETLVRQTD